ncbi:MAG: serine/threonine-protein kinase [Actinomycetota bacterium]
MSGAPDPPEIPNYRFVRYLDSGGFADVYLFTQEGIARNVALKVLRARDLSASSVETFQREARTMAAFAHRNVVTIHDFGIASDGRPYISMEYCPDHMGRIMRRRPVGVERVVRVGIQIAGAVDTAHGAGIIHRDIKPANILIRENNEPVLTDFGIAGTRDEQGPTGLTIPYSPPEALRGSTDDEVRADVYALGATIFALLAGRSPFEIPGGDNSERAFVGRILNEAPVAPERSDIPRALDAVLARSLATEPADRHRSAAEFARSLQQVEASLGYPATPFEGAQRRGSSTTLSETADEIDRTRVQPHVDAEERTRMRSGPGEQIDDAPTRIPPPVDTPGQHPDDGANDQATGERNRLPLVLGATAVIIALIVIVVVATQGGGGETTQETIPDVTTPFEFGAPPPVPSDVTVERDNTDAVVSWDPGETEPDDQYVVQVTEGPAAGPAFTTDSTTVRVDATAADAAFCVVVSAERNGVASEFSTPVCAS